MLSIYLDNSLNIPISGTDIISGPGTNFEDNIKTLYIADKPLDRRYRHITLEVDPKPAAGIEVTFSDDLEHWSEVFELPVLDHRTNNPVAVHRRVRVSRYEPIKLELTYKLTAEEFKDYITT